MSLSRSKIAAFFLISFLGSAFPARAEMTDYPVVKMQSLDKVTARTVTFEANVGSTIKFGPIYIKIQACRKPPPIEKPEAAAFLQIWQATARKKPEWIFSGWMFASSPSLSPMDHPIYDVWVIDCLDEVRQAEKETTPPAAGDPGEKLPETGSAERQTQE